jgi:RNA polymerase sigma factor (sigma-70 family)
MRNPGSLLRFIRRITAPGDAAADRQLLERFVFGRDESAFTALVERHGPMVLGVCRRVLNNAHDAEDAFQAAFLVLARKAGSLSRPDALGSWLYGVAYRTALEARARAAQRRARERELAEEPTVDPSGDVVWGDLRPVLDAEINRLPDRYRSPFVLCYLEGRTNEEAARLLRCPKGTILSRLAWARQRLRDRLARRGVALSAAGAAAVFSAEYLSAAVSAELARTTASAAGRFVAGQVVTPVEVVTLAREVQKAMFLDECKVVALLFAAVALLAGGLAWLDQPSWASGTRPQANPAQAAKDAGRLETLFALEKGVWEMTRKKDGAGLRKVCTKDFLTIHSDGSRLTLDEVCDALPFIDIKSYSLSDVRLISLGPDAAVLVYKAASETVFWGMPWRELTEISSTWVRREGAWRSVFTQETPIEE